MIAYLKRKLGIKDYKVCMICGLLFEPDPREEATFNIWCPEHRKPFLEQRALERWAVNWAARKPNYAKEIKTADDVETNKTKEVFYQNLVGVTGNWPQYYP